MPNDPAKPKVNCPKCGRTYRWHAEMAKKKVLCLCNLKFRMPFQPRQSVLVVTAQGDLPPLEYFRLNPHDAPSPPTGSRSKTIPPADLAAQALEQSLMEQNKPDISDLAQISGTMMPKMDSGGSAFELSVREKPSNPKR